MGATHFTGPVYSENGFVGATSNDGVNLTLSGRLSAATIGASDETLAITIADTTGDATFAGDATVGGTFDVTGDTTVVNITASGDVIFSNLPTADPEVEGQLWSDGGVLTVSGGPL